MKVTIKIYSEQLDKDDLRLLLQAIRDCEQKNFKDKGIFVGAEVPDLTVDEMSEVIKSIEPSYYYGPLIFKYREE